MVGFEICFDWSVCGVGFGLTGRMACSCVFVLDCGFLVLLVICGLTLGLFCLL